MWHDATESLRREFVDLLDRDRLRELHRLSGTRHALVALRQFGSAAAVALIVFYRDQPWIWVPAAVLLGFMIFSFTVLLHEVVHHAVFANRRGAGNRVLAWVYAVPCGLSPGQFTRWHLDHHKELGDANKDPKRHHLTPKIVQRWFKLLYFTPALFPIYFRAAGLESSTYEPKLRARLRLERAVVMSAHFSTIAALWFFWDGAMLFKLYALPVFFVFPVAFTINRLGQHYDIEPDDPAAWGTLVRTNPVWNYLFVWSSYHMEHHYFPGVPCYRLRELHDVLQPILERHPMRRRTYSGLLWDWLVRNRSPHLNWH